MHADWIQSIERQLAEVPPGCLLESPVSQVPRLHRPGPHWAGRGRVETFSLFPGLTLSHLCFQSETFSHRHAARDSGLEITHCRRGRVGWEMKEGLTLYLGPGDLSLHPMDCCAHSTLRFPLGYYEGFSISLNPDTLYQALPPALALGGVSPQEILRRFCPQGHPMSLPAQTALDHIFSPLYDLPESLRLPYYTLKVQELLLYLSQQAPAGERASNQYLSQQVEIIRAIHDQLMAHPNQRTTIEALAKEYHLNTSTLKAVFKAVYGQPIASHMKHHRMQEAARLLRETDLSIGDIAQQVGYENQSKFSNVFRDIFQVLPTEYRRQQSRDSKTEGRL